MSNLSNSELTALTMIISEKYDKGVESFSYQKASSEERIRVKIENILDKLLTEMEDRKLL